jgi:hypothetical protein
MGVKRKACMGSLWERIKQNRQGMIMAATAVAVVLGWRAVVLARQPSHWREAARELGSVPQFARQIYPNHAGTFLAYGQQMENAQGLYFCDPARRESRLVSGNNPQFYGWSPDDRRFAFGVALADRPGDPMALVICDGQSGQEVTRLQHPGFAGGGPTSPKGFTWLSAGAFAFYANGTVGVIEQRPDKSWFRSKTIPVSVTNPAGFTAGSPGEVAWQNGNAIELLNLAAETMQTVWNSTTNQLEDFISSPAGPELLLKCVDGEGQYLLRVSLRNGAVAAAGRIDPAHKGSFRLHSVWNDDSPTFISWAGGLPETVYLSEDGLNTFHVSNGSAAGRVLPWGGAVMVHSSVASGHLFIAGQPATGEFGVWDYDARKDTLEKIAPTGNLRFKHAAFVQPSYGTLTNASGQVKGYSIWVPAGRAPGRKYPLIIGQTGNGTWFNTEQTAPNCGYLFAVVHRPYWLCRSLSDWPADVAALHDVMRQHPNVDTNRVYLWGTSAESGWLAQSLCDQPNRWRGAIVFSPGGGITTRGAGAGKQVILIAGDESGDAQRMRDYQNRALPEGVAVKLYLQADKQHSPNTIRTIRERTEIFARILCEDL